LRTANDHRPEARCGDMPAGKQTDRPSTARSEPFAWGQDHSDQRFIFRIASDCDPVVSP